MQLPGLLIRLLWSALIRGSIALGSPIAPSDVAASDDHFRGVIQRRYQCRNDLWALEQFESGGNKASCGLVTIMEQSN